MSSTQRRWLGSYSSIFMPLFPFSRFNLKISSPLLDAMNRMCEIVSRCLTPLLILIFSTLCLDVGTTVSKLFVYVFQNIYMHTLYSLFLECCQYCLGLSKSADGPRVSPLGDRTTRKYDKRDHPSGGEAT